ncbi:hypothetical protein CBR_g38672 [Chara braunii]|uniref:Serine incorporator n=1 Tax=Chara braunii TaxID=69332 RepID=A0A388K0R2_CHABU|nr:hypothetical protein CBR_g38672 [Chara braunii]|eukprot:GBG63606.1 hypothetical protein CBR_g38672 [Chara braunii]
MGTLTAEREAENDEEEEKSKERGGGEVKEREGGTPATAAATWATRTLAPLAAFSFSQLPSAILSYGGSLQLQSAQLRWQRPGRRTYWSRQLPSAAVSHSELPSAALSYGGRNLGDEHSGTFAIPGTVSDRHCGQREEGTPQTLRQCLEEQRVLQVLRVTLTGVLFFSIMCISTLGANRKDSLRDTWHSAFWPAKVAGLFGLLLLSFLGLPEILLRAFGVVSIVGSGVFVVIQILIFLDWIYSCNEDWLSDDKLKRCMVPVIVIAVLSYILCLVGIGVLYHWFVPSARRCPLNTFFVTFTLVICVVITCISILPQVMAGPLTSGLTSLYLVYLCWSALTSQPPVACRAKEEYGIGEGGGVEGGGSPGTVTIIGFVLAFLSILIATFTAGLEYQSFTLKRRDESDPYGPRGGRGLGDDDSLPYSYSFFHLVFLTGSMYVGMLLLGWDLHQGDPTKLKLDHGWTAMWVKMGSQWACAALYVWTMVAPLLLKNRDFR